jgi:hypothetical protein
MEEKTINSVPVTISGRYAIIIQNLQRGNNMMTDQSLLITRAVLLAAGYILYSIGFRGIFRKAGVAPGKAFIPLYHFYPAFAICWEGPASVIWLLFQAVAVISNYLYSAGANSSGAGVLQAASLICGTGGLIFMIIWSCNLSHAFRHGKGFILGLILLNPFFIMALGLGKSEYDTAYKPVTDSADAQKNGSDRKSKIRKDLIIAATFAVIVVLYFIFR